MRKSRALAAGLGCLLLLFVVSVSGRPQSSQQSIHREDCYGFELERLSVNHQGKNVLHLTVLYRYAPCLKSADYMDVNQLRKAVLNAIRTYPNKSDYWEVCSEPLHETVS